MTSQFKYVQNSRVCSISAGITCRQVLSTNPEPNADTDGYGFAIGI